MMTEGLRSWVAVRGSKILQNRSDQRVCGEDVMVLTEWGSGGVEALRDQAAVLVIVDVLSFSTAVDVAVSSGAVVYPLPYGDEDAAQAAAERVGTVLAKPRRSSVGQFSLSPQSLMAAPAGTRIILPSPNGVTDAKHHECRRTREPRLDCLYHET